MSREVGLGRVRYSGLKGARPWGGGYAYSMVLGVVKEAPGTATGAGISKGRTALVAVAVVGTGFWAEVGNG